MSERGPAVGPRNKSMTIQSSEKLIYCPPGVLALGVHVAVVLRDLGAGPVRHAPGPRRVLRVSP